MLRKMVLGLCFTMILSSCSIYRIDSEEVTTNFYSPKEVEEIEVLDTVSRPHDVVGYVTVNAERSQNMSEILYKMKEEAAKLGGHAVTNIQSNATGTWKKIPAQKFLGNAYVRANFTATVIAFPEE